MRTSTTVTELPRLSGYKEEVELASHRLLRSTRNETSYGKVIHSDVVQSLLLEGLKIGGDL